jgi:hypothetical protein
LDDGSPTEQQLAILHDHYKESFALVREAEISRDRLFLWVMALFSLLTVEVGYPAAVGGAVGRLEVAGAGIDLSALPLAALLNATWVVTLAIMLRYCQASILVDRRYRYIHYLEDRISPALGGDGVYRREGKFYLDNYPLILNVTWLAYVIIFPMIALVATVGLLVWEWHELPYRWFHLVFDSAVATALMVVLFLYRVQPYVARKFKALNSKRRSPAP